MWPDFFPDGCPTEEAKVADGQFYRVVPTKDTRSLKGKHLLSQREKQMNQPWPPEYNKCDFCAVSLMQDIEDAKKLALRLLRTIPAYKYCVGKIAIGDLDAACGKIKHSPDRVNGYESHHNWWRYDDVQAIDYFQFTGIVVERS